MNKQSLIAIGLCLSLLACKSETSTPTNAEIESKKVTEKATETNYTLLTEENFGLAESQMIFMKYIRA